MWARGPEELMVKAKVDPRAELAQYAHFEGSRAAVRATDAMLRRELDFLPVKRSPLQRLARWARGERRYDRAPLAAAPAVCPRAPAAGARVAADARAVERAGLAALPALERELETPGAPSPPVMVPFVAYE